MTPGKLSRELRQGSGAFLGQRRAVVGLSLTTMAALGVIVLYQVGIIAHVPEPNLPGFDGDKVNGSDQAYELLATPDGILGLGSYTATMALAAMGGQNRAEEQPWIPLALAAKVLVDAAQSTRLTIDQATKQKAFCLWCLVTMAATYATVPLAIPEARAALRTLRGKTA